MQPRLRVLEFGVGGLERGGLDTVDVRRAGKAPSFRVWGGRVGKVRSLSFYGVESSEF